MKNKKLQTCPICKKPWEVDYKPFCSDRCAKIDLGYWLTDSYRIETDEKAPESLSSSTFTE